MVKFVFLVCFLVLIAGASSKRVASRTAVVDAFCAENNGGCDVNAVCKTVVGGRSCTCKPGFVCCYFYLI